MSTIDAFHLPGLADNDVANWQTFDAGPHTLRAPILTAAGLRSCIARLVHARTALAEIPLADIISTIDAVARKLRDPADPVRVLLDEAVPHLTGYSPAMSSLIIDRMAQDWTRPALERVLAAELGDGAILEQFVRQEKREVMAVAPRLVTHVFAGNIPGVAVTSLVRALLVRAASLGKTASEEPLLAPLFAQAIAAQNRIVGNALAVTYWPGGDQISEETAFAAADAVVVYGGATALAAVRRLAPPHVRVLDHGPRLSAGFVARDALGSADAATTLARDIAHAVATFDQQGCVSPHAVFVECDGMVSARGLAESIAGELRALQRHLPRGSLTPAEAAAIRETRTRAEFASDMDLVSGPDEPFTVILSGRAAFDASCLQRTIVIHDVRTLDEALSMLAPHRPLLQSAALAGDDGFGIHLARAGFTRITSFARIPWPDPAEYHDGRGPLTEFLSFVERAV